MAEITYSDYKISRPYSSNEKEFRDENGNIVERFLDVVTPNGVVDVTAFRYEGFGTTTVFMFVYGGRQYEKRYEGKFYSTRYCVTLANDFVCDLLED